MSSQPETTIDLNKIDPALVKTYVYAIVENEDRVLLIQDKFQKGWKFPGGLVKESEKIISALTREVKEVFDGQVELSQIIYIANWYRRNDPQVALRIFFVSQLKGSYSQIIDKDVTDLKWFDHSALLGLDEKDFLFEHYYHALQSYFRYKKMANGASLKYEIEGVDLIVA